MKPARAAGLRVLVMDARGASIAGRGLAGWLAGVAPRRARGVVNVVLVSDARMRTLNREFRRKDGVTDVLSFPSASGVQPRASKFLGDIVIAKGMARRQARMAGHAELAELRLLSLHGLLHLMGYDHHTDNGMMARLERKLRRKGGLREGLIERARAK